MTLGDIPDGSEIFAESLKKAPVERTDFSSKKASAKTAGARDAKKKKAQQ
jgi:hypothetical protein